MTASNITSNKNNVTKPHTGIDAHFACYDGWRPKQGKPSKIWTDSVRGNFEHIGGPAICELIGGNRVASKLVMLLEENLMYHQSYPSNIAIRNSKKKSNQILFYNF